MESLSKYLIKNYQSTSPLLTFNYFIQKQLFTDCESSFIQGCSCVAQLLSLTHEIYKILDCNPPCDIRGIFLDISKALDKVWHKDLMFKLKSYGVDGGLFKLMENYLTGLQQTVVLNGQTFFVGKYTGWIFTGFCVTTSSIFNSLNSLMEYN